jgi:hypothetical protein
VTVVVVLEYRRYRRATTTSTSLRLASVRATFIVGSAVASTYSRIAQSRLRRSPVKHCGEVEHGVKEYGLHNGAQSARPCLAIDRLLGDSSVPSLERVNEVMISQQAVEGTAGPLYMYAGGRAA